MAKKDFFDSNVETPEDEKVDEKIRLGDKEYTEAELNDLVGLGQTARELESKWNTKVDSLLPEYTKSRQELKDWKEKYEKTNKELGELRSAQNQQPTGALTQEQKDAVRAQLKELGVSFTGELDSWYVTKRQAEKLMDEMNDLQDEINGNDGRPKFVTNDILDYMVESGIRKPLDAYELKFKPQLKEWEQKELNASKPNKLYTSEVPTAGGEKQPKDVKVTRDNLSEMVREALGGSSE